MHSFSSCLTEDSVYTLTKQAYERWQVVDKKSDECVAIKSKLEHWETIRRKMDRFIESRGNRYAECTFKNYEVANNAQERVVLSLIEYAKKSKGTTQNVLLLGTKGTGKDHLLMALAKACFMEAGIVPLWQNGVDLLHRFHRDALNGSALSQFDELSRSDVLYVSDPLPPAGVLSDAKQTGMFRLIDSRYSGRKPIWMTMNVADGTEAERIMGSQTVDRLRDGALVLFCNWESYRKASKPGESQR